MWYCRLVCEGLVKDRLVEEEGDGTDLHDAIAGEMKGIVSAYDDHLAEEVVAFAKRQKFMWVIKKKFFYADFTCQVKSA